MIYLFMIGAWQMILLTIAVVVLATTLAALVDILKNDFTGNNKIVWLLVVLLANFPGAVLYFLMGRQQKIGGIR